MTHKPVALTDDARKHLLARVEAMRDAGPPASLARPTSVTATIESPTDFGTLPGYSELRALRVVGEKAGIANPYFRVHDGRAGAHTEIGGLRLLNFSCYDYLGLNGHPEIVAAAKATIDRYGVSCSGSRCVSGERTVHGTLERALARHYGAEDCVVMVSGYATNVGVIGQLLGPKDLLIHDAAIHNSALMGGVLSGAARRSFSHNDFDNLDQTLASVRRNFERVLIVVEGVYSMDGDYPDLLRLIDIKRRHRAWLMVDEAHALGVLGDRGRGIAEHFNVDPCDVDIWMGTLSKTLVSCGGYIAGSAELIDYLKSFAGAFVYSVGIPPVIAATAEKALEIMHREPRRVERLRENSALFHDLANKHELKMRTPATTAVCAIMTGDSLPAALLSDRLFARGINVQPVMYPGVPAKESRLRFFITEMHSRDEIEATVAATAEEFARIPETVRALYAKANKR